MTYNVYQYDQYDKAANEPIGEFETAYQASKQLNINYSGINQVVSKVL